MRQRMFNKGEKVRVVKTQKTTVITRVLNCNNGIFYQCKDGEIYHFKEIQKWPEL